MSSITDPAVTHTTSADGTTIGYYTSGQGPPLLLVHGSLGDHSRWDALRPYLEPHFTVHAMDRRGRGASGDSPNYSIAREYEDVAAVVDSIAASAGSAVDVYCSSFGGLCALGANSLTSYIRRLALYEAWPAVNPGPLSISFTLLDRVEALLAKGNRDAALEAAYRDGLGLDSDALETMRAQPSWPGRVAAAHTIPREARAFDATLFDPDQAARITVPTLLMVGSESSDWRAQVEHVAAALPSARITVLEGQGHIADLLAPEVVAETLLPFLREQ